IWVPPPGRWTTVTFVLTSFPATKVRSIARASLSLVPPGATGTTISTFFCGAQPCAIAPQGKRNGAKSKRWGCFMAPTSALEDVSSLVLHRPADLRLEDFGRVQRPVGIVQKGARHDHDVGLAVGQHLLRHVGAVDQAHCPGGD